MLATFYILFYLILTYFLFLFLNIFSAFFRFNISPNVRRALAPNVKYHIPAVSNQRLRTGVRPNHKKKSDNKKLAEKTVCVCGRRFSYVGGLTYHKKWECGKLLKCEKCSKHFNVRSYYLNHCRTCDGKGSIC